MLANNSLGRPAGCRRRILTALLREQIKRPGGRAQFDDLEPRVRQVRAPTLVVRPPVVYHFNP